MASVDLFDCPSAVTIREIAIEASRLTGLRVRPAIVRKIRRGLAARYHEQRIDEIDGRQNPWQPNGHVSSLGMIGPTYTFTDVRAAQLLRAVVQHVQTRLTTPRALRISDSPFSF